MYLSDYTLDQICDELKICISTLQKLRKKLNLPNRKNPSTYIESDFIKAYSDGLSNHQLAKMFCMERRTVQKRIQELNLPPRKNESSYEDYFRKAHKDGLTVPQLAERFHISRSHVYVCMRKFGLSYTSKTKTTFVEPAIEPSQPSRENKKTNEQVINLKRPEPIVRDTAKVETMTATFSMPPKTLKEIQKLQLQQDMKRAERQYKITHKENGFGSLVKEIDNPINLTFR